MNSNKSDILFCFDLDDTLYDQLIPFELAIRKHLDLPTNFNYLNLFKRVRYYSDVLWTKHCKGSLPLEQLRTQRLIFAFKECKHDITEQMAVRLQEEYEREQQNIVFFPGVSDCFDKLLKNNIHIGLLTNGPVQHQMNKIKVLQVEDFVLRKNIFISDEVGIAKPEQGIFQYVSSQIGIAPENSYYVGDSWKNDIIPSLSLGWKSLWFNYRNRESESQHQPHLIFDHFSQLSAYI